MGVTIFFTVVIAIANLIATCSGVADPGSGIEQPDGY
jgi:hypothetical protein